MRQEPEQQSAEIILGVFDHRGAHETRPPGSRPAANAEVIRLAPYLRARGAALPDSGRPSGRSGRGRARLEGDGVDRDDQEQQGEVAVRQMEQAHRGELDAGDTAAHAGEQQV